MKNHLAHSAQGIRKAVSSYTLMDRDGAGSTRRRAPTADQAWFEWAIDRSWTIHDTCEEDGRVYVCFTATPIPPTSGRRELVWFRLQALETLQSRRRIVGAHGSVGRPGGLRTESRPGSASERMWTSRPRAAPKAAGSVGRMVRPRTGIASDSREGEQASPSRATSGSAVSSGGRGDARHNHDSHVVKMIFAPTFR